MNQAWVTVTCVTFDARALVPIRFVEQDTGRGVSGVVPHLDEVVDQELDTVLMRNSWEGIGPAGRRICGVGAPVSVDLVDPFCLGVVGF
jgi:hypothetical protein